MFNELKKEVRIEFYKGRGPGGQHRNKTLSCVRLMHEPSNVRVIATEFRSQFRNKALAFERLQEKLKELNAEKAVRIITKKTQHEREKVLHDKKMRSFRKQSRRRVDD